MKVIVDLCVVPLGVGVSLSPYVAACERVVREAGLAAQLHAYGTNIEGEWDEVFAAIKRCHEVVHAMGAPRISTTLKLGTRSDRVQTMEEKVASVREKLAGDAPVATAAGPEAGAPRRHRGGQAMISSTFRSSGVPLPSAGGC